MRPTSLLLASALLLAACGSGAPPSTDAIGVGGDDASAAGVGGASSASSSASSASSGGGEPAVEPGLAPAGAVDGEVDALDGANAVSAASDDNHVLRVDLEAGEHASFFLSFDDAGADVVLELSRWSGYEAVPLGATDAGAGLRALAAFDAAGPRTFWVRVSTPQASFEGSLKVTRTPFEDGATCAGDCAKLLQLPLANNPEVDGYDHADTTVFRYQFARRDLLMFFRHAARRMADAGRSPIVPEDFSQWDGKTPGVDVGAPRHASHAGGNDVDISLYGADGEAPWRSYCTTVNTAKGRECAPGSAKNFDGRANAEMYAGFLETGKIKMAFLDQVLIAPVRAGADAAVDAGTMDPALKKLFHDGVRLQHWPNHDNHIHVRVVVDDTAGGAARVLLEGEDDDDGC